MARQRSPRLADVARPRDDGSGYDYAAIAGGLSFAQRYALGQLGVDQGVFCNARALRSLVEAGLALGGCPPRITMLGEQVLEQLGGAQS